ncbi:MAG: hypothetical protein IPH35_13630 [Rhodoferax sp.]|nr:hypothetical protein [Rhodoferax sp.]
MVELSHWDFAQRFTGVELAALMMGLDPNASGFDPQRVAHVLRDVERAFFLAREYLVSSIETSEEMRVGFADEKSIAFFRAQREQRYIPALESENISAQWSFGRFPFLRSYVEKFSEQFFTREKIILWLRENSIMSVYRFDIEVPVTPAPTKTTAPVTAAPTETTSPVKDEQLSKRERTTYLNTIAVLVELMQSPKPDRGSEAAIIREMLANYSDLPGISKRKLEDVFRDAKQSMKSS